MGNLRLPRAGDPRFAARGVGGSKLSACFWTMARQPLWLMVGWTHASRVIPVVRFSDGAPDATGIVPVMPLKLKALPYRPWTSTCRR